MTSDPVPLSQWNNNLGVLVTHDRWPDCDEHGDERKKAVCKMLRLEESLFSPSGSTLLKCVTDNLGVVTALEAAGSKEVLSEAPVACARRLLGEQKRRQVAAPKQKPNKRQGRDRDEPPRRRANSPRRDEEWRGRGRASQRAVRRGDGRRGVGYNSSNDDD